MLAPHGVAPLCTLLSFCCSRHHRALHSFPTRRSSDLKFRNIPSMEIQLNPFWDGGVACKDDCVKSYDPIPQRTVHRGPNRLLVRSEEHTSELQSRENLVCRLLLEKKKKRAQTSRNREI